MAAGVTDHVWTLREMLFYRVPPWPQSCAVSKVNEDDERDVRHDKSAYDQLARLA
jgi:hypothetical protein